MTYLSEPAVRFLSGRFWSPPLPSFQIPAYRPFWSVSAGYHYTWDSVLYLFPCDKQSSDSHLHKRNYARIRILPPTLYLHHCRNHLCLDSGKPVIWVVQQIAGSIYVTFFLLYLLPDGLNIRQYHPSPHNPFRLCEYSSWCDQKYIGGERQKGMRHKSKNIDVVVYRHHHTPSCQSSPVQTPSQPGTPAGRYRENKSAICHFKLL